MKKNMLHLLGALVIASMLCGSLEVNAMRTGYWNRAGNAARTGWNQTQNMWTASRGIRRAGAVGVGAGYLTGEYSGFKLGYSRRVMEEGHDWGPNKDWLKKDARNEFEAREAAKRQKDYEKRQAKHKKDYEEYLRRRQQ